MTLLDAAPICRAMVASIALMLVGCSRPPCAAKFPPRVAQRRVPTEIPGTSRIAAVGDLQGTHLGELLLLRERNRAKTDELMCRLGEERVDATVLLGDLVTVGESEGSWQRFDDLANRLNGVLLPVRGNHDYWGNDAAADAEWSSRFPWSEQAPWYGVRWGRIGLVFLNSNLSALAPQARVAQQLFFEKQLESLESDPLVEGTIVFLHHPPFTVNPNADDDLEILQQVFAAPFCRHGKAMAMISGHAHGYERYEKLCRERTVEFIVSGGGGGPRPFAPPVFADACLASGHCEPRYRPLNYLLLTQSDRLEIQVKGYDESGMQLIEAIELSFDWLRES